MSPRADAELAREDALAGSQIQRFLILHKELDPDDDELTRTRKVCGLISHKHAALIDARTRTRWRATSETQVKFEDGRSGIVRADVQIARRAPLSAPEQLKKAG